MDGLDETANEAIGQTLRIRTSYGYGWTNPGTSDPTPLPDFSFELCSLWCFGGKLRGGIGQIAEPDHPADQLWVVFSTRHTAHYNFRDKLGQYNLSIGKVEPVPNESGWPVFSSGPLHAGWGCVGYPDALPE